MHEKVPLVLINDHNPDLKIELLELDSKKSGRLIAAHLLELGHRDIGYMTTPLSSIEVPRRRRLEGMQEEYERQGLDSSFIHVISGKREEQETITGNKHYDTGYGLTRKYFKKREDILKKKEETKSLCCCGGTCTPDTMEKAEEKKTGMGVKVLGGGCAKCNQLEAATVEALTELGMDTTIEHIKDWGEIASYGVMTTPALVIDGKVVSFGKVLKKDEVVKILKEVRG